MAVTLLIAGGVGAMVLGVTAGVGQGPSDVTFTLSTSNIADDVDDNDQISLQHAGGSRFVTGDVSIRVGETIAYRNGTVVADPDEDGTDELAEATTWGSSATEGAEQTIREEGSGDVFEEDDVVEVLWNAPDGREVVARLVI